MVVVHDERRKQLNVLLEFTILVMVAILPVGLQCLIMTAVLPARLLQLVIVVSLQRLLVAAQVAALPASPVMAASAP